MQLGRVPWPAESGNVLDFARHDAAADVVPFARDAERAYGYQLDPRFAHRPALLEDLRAMAAERDARAADSDLGGGVRDEAVLEADDLREEATALARRRLAPLRMVEVALSHVGKVVPLDDDDDMDPVSFDGWLEARFEGALGDEAFAAQHAAEPLDDAPETADPPDDVEKTLDLLDALSATARIVVCANYDDDACARRLAGYWGQPAAFLDALVDDPTIDEVFATEDEIERAMAAEP